MSTARLPAIVCDGEPCAVRQTPVTLFARWLGETALELRRAATGYGWLRRHGQDLCPSCSGAFEARSCACGAKFYSIIHTQKQCVRCAPEDYSLPGPRTLEDAHADEVRAATRLT